MTTVPLKDFKHHIQAALLYMDGLYNYEDIAKLVEKGTLQFWPGVDSVILTEIIEYPRQRVLEIFLAGGNLAEIEAMAHDLEGWARAQGCQEVLFTGRNGWERTFLARTGWTPIARVFKRKL